MSEFKNRLKDLKKQYEALGKEIKKLEKYEKGKICKIFLKVIKGNLTIVFESEDVNEYISVISPLGVILKETRIDKYIKANNVVVVDESEVVWLDKAYKLKCISNGKIALLASPGNGTIYADVIALIKEPTVDDTFITDIRGCCNIVTVKEMINERYLNQFLDKIKEMDFSIKT